MSCPNLKNKRQKINGEHLNFVKFVPHGNTKYSQCIQNFK